MIEKLYTFVGCTTALSFYINRSTAADKATALGACAQLQQVSESMLAAVGNSTSEEAFKELCGEHVVTVLESIETLRGTSIHGEFNDTFLALLEHYYAAADALAGGGNGPLVPTSLCSSFA